MTVSELIEILRTHEQCATVFVAFGKEAFEPAGSVRRLQMTPLIPLADGSWRRDATKATEEVWILGARPWEEDACSKE